MRKEGKDGIEWCDYTQNPIIGCKRGCPYCYAKKLNDRFRFVKDFSVPEERLSGFETVKTKRSVSIFFDSMSDFEFWSHDQTDEFLGLVFASSDTVQWVGLSKSPKAIADLRAWADRSVFGERLWLGYSCGSDELARKAVAEALNGLMADFLSIEPLSCDLASSKAFSDVVSKAPRLQAAIIGAETGNRKGKTVCEKGWVSSLSDALTKAGKAVFMKKSVKELMGDGYRQDALPWPCDATRRSVRPDDD